MSEQFERVEPTPFSSPEPTPEGAPPATGTAGTGGERPPWLVPALAGLGVLALAVVFLLPLLVDPDPATPSASRPAPNVADSGAPAAPRPATKPQETTSEEAPSPFADAVEAKARSAAQDVLAELLDVQDNLIERGAENWAAAEMVAIAAVAATGDTLYRERQFDAALEQYEAALGDALVLESSIPERFDALLDETRVEIEDFDAEAAEDAMARARQLESAHPELLGLLDRLEALPAVTAAAERAEIAESARDYQAAVDAMQEAAALDGEHQYVASELVRLEALLLSYNFNTAMSEGYAALEANRFDTAQARFNTAARLRPNAPEAPAALTELAVARTAAELRSLKSQGEKLVAEESWSDAVEVFEKALAIDSSLRFANEGLALAKPRGELNKELGAILDDPGRLVDDAILREAQASLAKAQAVSDPGPKLAAQISRAEETLRAASTPVEITLRSDGMTTVTVYKVARLGQFDAQQLSLRPGLYTAVGSRRGYRDVRRQFTVTAQGLSEPVTIACSDSI